MDFILYILKKKEYKVKGINMLELLEKIESKKNKLKVFLKNKDNVKILFDWLKVELAYTSNAIEGNTLTRRETALVIEDNIASGSKELKNYLEARNHADAFNYIFACAQNKMPVTENVVLKIHKEILKGIDDSNAGFYRSVRVFISHSRAIPANPVKVPDLMSDMGKWLENAKDEPVLKAIEAHYKLVTIHPFVDGNGRTARLLMNLILLENGFCPMIIHKRDKKMYLRVLETAQTTQNKEPYVKFMLQMLNKSLSIVLNRLNIERADINPNKLLKIGEFSKMAGLPISTIRYWVQIGKLKPMEYTQGGLMLFDKAQLKEIKAKSVKAR